MAEQDLKDYADNAPNRDYTNQQAANDQARTDGSDANSNR